MGAWDQHRLSHPIGRLGVGDHADELGSICMLTRYLLLR